MERAGVWCTISRHHIFRQFFFTSIVNVAVYRDIIMQFIYCAVDNRRMSVLLVARWFDSSFCYRNDEFSASILWWSANFEGFLWPLRSLDLTPPDFFLWCLTRKKVFESSVPASLDDLRSSCKDYGRN